ncbi:MAG: hypothetical protein QOK04_2334 [Solirubrobacteraceae bacterium]|nr:hypothetical protein [Solirubrobacteraceae bacterium]
MRVGLNLTFLTADSGGSGRYARELIPALLAAEPNLRLTAFVSADVPAALHAEPWAEVVEWVRFPHRPTRPGVIRPVVSMLVQWGALPAIAARRRLDLVHGLANVVPILAPRVRTVVTVLDLIWLRHPQTMPARATIGMRIVTPRSARSADRVIAISETVRDDLIATLGLDPGKIDVTHLAVRMDATAPPTPPEELRRRLGLGNGRVVLCVAQLRRHKNLVGLIKAVAGLDDDIRLVIVGSPTGYEDDLTAVAREHSMGDRLVLPGWIPEADLEGLYRLAECFVLPSFEEGFGLPVLEAMRRETPVACSDVPSLREVVGEAALLFDPHKPTAIADAIARLLSDGALRSKLAARGLERCREFTWEATAQATLASYRRALGG